MKKTMDEDDDDNGDDKDKDGSNNVKIPQVTYMCVQICTWSWSHMHSDEKI